MIYKSFSSFKPNEKPEIKDIRVVFKKTNWLVVKETSELQVKSSNAKDFSRNKRKTEEILSNFSPELSNQTILEPLKLKSKSQPHSKLKAQILPNKNYFKTNHDDILLSNIKSLEKQIEFYESQNHFLKSSLSTFPNSSKSRIESLKSESLKLKTRILDLNRLISEDKSILNSFSFPDPPDESPSISSKHLNLKFEISRLSSKKSSKISSWKSKLSKTKEKIHSLTSEITSLSSSLKAKQLTCRKMVVLINTQARLRRKSP
jgi:hypothetical protein